MDKNLLLERRYSFNSFNVSSQMLPGAESTRLNSNANSQMSNSFPWGICDISPRKSKDKSTFAYSNSTMGEYKARNLLRESSRSQNNISKIDSRIFADVQSKGLASRIVKYHENESRLNRNMSAYNLYIKPGQFPVVNLNKSQLPLRATKQTVSMTYIAPPDKPAFHGNTISSLLRSSSVVGLHKSDEEISRENRPIIHPPPTENDMAPTRSVLEVLKEISRKRINNEDSTLNETNKKHCERSGNDTIDIASGGQPLNQNQDSISTQSYKRQRDGSVNYCRTTIPGGPSSPEQVKKRLCSYNNDITSSLSSSMKRKLYDPKQYSEKLSRTSPTFADNCEIQKSKIQKQQGSFDVEINNRIKTASNDAKSVIPITPIPATPTTQDHDLNSMELQRNNLERSPSYRNTDIIKDRKQLAENIETNKPRLTLFNKTYENSNADNTLTNNADYDDCVGIQFVKPKKTCSISNIKNPIIERTQKSKLALMLCGLKGEIYQGHNAEDHIDSGKTDGESEIKRVEESNDTMASSSANKDPVTSAGAAESSSTAVNSLEATGTESIGATPHLIMPTSIVTAPVATSIVTAAVTSPKKPTTTTSPLVGIKLTPQSSNVSSNTPTAAIAINVSDDVAKLPTIPRLGGFNFSSALNKATANITTTISTKPTFTSPLTGIKSTPQNFNTDSITTTALTTPVAMLSTTPKLCGFNINSALNGAIDKNEVMSNNPPIFPTTTTTTTMATTNLNIGFALNSVDTLKPITTLAKDISTTTESLVINSNAFCNSNSTPTFSFGLGNQMSNTSQSSNITSNLFMNSPSNPLTLTSTQASAASLTPFSFGSNKTTEQGISPSAATVTTRAFNFNATPSNAVSAPLTTSVFSSSQTIATPNNDSKPTFFFGAPPSEVTNAKALTPTVTSSDSFSFGSAQSVVPTAKTQPNVVQKSFSFGSPAPVVNNAETKTFSFFNTGTSKIKTTGVSTVCSTQTTTTTTATIATPKTSTLSSLTFQPSKPLFGSSTSLNSQTSGTNIESAHSRNPSIFASPMTNQKAIVFGSSNNPLAIKKDENLTFDPNAVIKAPSIFGAPCNLFAPKKDEVPIFGSSATNQTPSLFSSQNNPIVSKKDEKAPVGSNAANQTISIFGSSNNLLKPTIDETPTFGSMASNPTATIFGASSNLSLLKKDETLSFGSTAVNQTSSPFGSANNQSIIPSFSSSADKIANRPFTFGSTSAGTGTFAFGNQSNSTSVPDSKTENNTFASLSANSTTSQPNTVFAFGNGPSSGNLFGSTTKSNETPTPSGKGFTFKATTTEALTNMFPSPVAATKTATTAFNTGAAAFRNTSASDSALKSANNVFAAPTEQRPIRRATRRLQK
ncbi:mucin-5AC [Glossina fuscipes]|uniref:Mucin-5AC n=1 Tax=Glossina fuscipes TaxID=7396 RepID=A0A9C6DZB7_9MUSC|nr:mucin-5AC [Glossina fuscipes]KAI9576083.1 hypothetical protein GQX74_014566 [Glossina fuscipes]